MKTVKFIRTCQECGYKLECKEPEHKQAASNAYLNKKCPKCKSEAFDYGSNKEVNRPESE